MEWLLVDGPLLASGLPGEFALHVRIEALKDGKTVFIVVVKPAGAVDPIPIVAGVHGTELPIMVADDVSIQMAWFNFFSGLYAVSNGIDHAVAKVRALIENDDLRVFIVVEKPGRVGPRMA